MKDSKLLLILGAGASLWLITRSMAKAAKVTPIEPTQLERQVILHSDLIWNNGVKYDVEPALVAAIMANESSGMTVPPRLVKVRLPTGAQSWDWVMGLMQLRLDTARIYCKAWADDAENVECGVKYLKQLLDRFGNVPDAVSAYNAGPGRVMMDVSIRGGMQYVNVDYIRNVLAMIPRFRLLFMGEKGADVYFRLFPGKKWQFEIP